MKRLAVLALSGFLLVGCTQAKTEQTTKSMDLPRDLDEKLNEPIDKIFDEWSTAGKVPGMVVVAAKDGKVIFEKAYGYAYLYDADGGTYDNPVYAKTSKPREMKTDTLFDLASLTKAMATTQSVMKLVSEGKLDVKEKVSKYLPGFEQNGKENVTIDQLLTHTSGLPQWEPTYLYCNNKNEQLEYIKKLSLNAEFVEEDKDRKSEHYSDFGFMTLGFVVEAITNESMDEYAKKNIYEPLGMKHTTYLPLDNGFTKEDIAATSLGNPYEYKMIDEKDYPDFGYDCTKDQAAFEQFNGWRKYTLIGEANDGNAAMGGNGVAGHAGLFSTASDLAILSQAMLNGGEYNGVKLYDKDTIDMFTTQHTDTGKESEEFGYCFKLDQIWMGDSATIHAYGHDGFTGTTVAIDPDNNLSIIVLTNKMQGGFRKGDGQNPNYYWNSNVMAKQIANAIRSELNI